MAVTAVGTALISVSDKSGVVEFARALVDAGVTVVSSGGTAAALTEAGIPVIPVATLTGHPEILGGRVKTLHPRIHGGILAKRDDATHLAELEANGIDSIDLVVVNLYPFSAAVQERDITENDAIEQIDIGGPAMIRAAAKNFHHVGVVTSPQQYDEVAGAVAAGGLDEGLRRRLARAAFFHTAAYDAAIVGWLERGDDLPARMVLPLQRSTSLRYGENPHQEAAVYQDAAQYVWRDGQAVFDPPVLIAATQLQGKEMSFNNYADAEAAWRQVLAFGMFEPAAVIVKHANPCGVALGTNAADAFRQAWACDPLSAFGSVVALNQPVTAETAAAVLEAGFVEVLVAPRVDEEAAARLATKPNMRVLTALAASGTGLDLRRISGGFLVQERDRVEGSGPGAPLGTVVSRRAPTEAEWADLRFAWIVAAHTKSNAIVIARGGAAVGIGAGDQSRVGAARRALDQAAGRASGAGAASDAFFPFRDGVDALAAAGVTAVVEPGGSRRDEEVVAAANEHGMSLVFTGTRHFLH